MLLWPVVWALCFALFAVLGQSAFSFKGEFGDELVKPFVTVATLWVAFKAPQLLARQAMLAGIAPSLGSGLARTIVYGRGAVGAAQRAGGERRRRGRQGRFAGRASGAGRRPGRRGAEPVANVTYKHLEGKTVVGQFSLGQWAQLLAGVLLGLVFGIYLSPLPPTPDDLHRVSAARAAAGGPLRRDGTRVLAGPGRAGGVAVLAPRRAATCPAPAPRRPATSSIPEPDPYRQSPPAVRSPREPGELEGYGTPSRRARAASCRRPASCWPSRRSTAPACW